MALVAGWILIFIAVISIFALAVGILVLVAQWKVYKKAGERGWASLIPFYSQYVLVKITWGNGWLFLLFFIPLGNLIFAIATNIKLARVFGKGGGYAAGLIFLSFIFLPMLAFGGAQYQGPDEKKSRGAIIATAVTGAGYILLMVILAVTGVVAGYSQYQSGAVYINEDDTYDDRSGADAVETYSARGILENGVASDIDLDELIQKTGITKEQLHFTIAPSKEDLKELDPIYLSYFLPWNSHENYLFAKTRGFHDLTGEWERTHTVEQYDQIDSRAYLVHPWLKYPKFGHASATDYAARYVRYGLMTREEAVEAVRLHDHALDPACVRDFCEFAGYTEEEFWAVVERFYNPELFEKGPDGAWRLKHPVWESSEGNL